MSERGRLIETLFSPLVPQLLYAMVSLGVADLLADGPATAEELASKSETHAPSLFRLLRAAVAADVVTLDDTRFALTATGRLLCRDVPGSVRNMVLWFASEDNWRTWGALHYSVRTGRDAFDHVIGESLFDRLARPLESARIFHDTMAEITRDVAGALPSLARHRLIADIGGGRGTMLAHLLAVHPHLRGILFDTDSGLVGAADTLSAVQDRCTVVAGDFFRSVPAGCDAYLLKSVIHNWSDEQAVAILRRCREAMAPDATLYLVEPIVPADLAATSPTVLARDLNMLVLLPGRERTEPEFAALLAAAGFTLASVTPLPPPGEPFALLTAT